MKFGLELTIDEDNKVYAVSGDTQVQLFDKFGFDILPTNVAGKTFNVTGVVGAIYDDAPQVFPTVIEEIVPENVTVTIGATGYGTLYYSDRALTVPEGVTAKTYKVESGSLVEVTSYSVIPAGEAVVLNAPEQTEETTYTFTVSSDAGTKVDGNMLLGTDEAEQTSGGTYYYALATNKDGDANSVGFYWQNSTGAAFQNGAHKAYLALDKKFSDMSQAKSAFLLSGEDISTGINGVSQNNNTGVRFNMQGQRVGNAYKGVVIMNGKKFLQK